LLSVEEEYAVSPPTILITATAVLADNTGADLSGQLITFTITPQGGSPETMPSGTTDATGTATSQITVPENMTYSVQASFAGTSAYEPSSATKSISVTQTQTNLTANVQSPLPAVGGNATITGSLDENGVGLGQETLTITVNGTAMPSITTASDGSFSFELIDVAAEKYSVVISFPGTGAYTASSTTVSFTISSLPSPASKVVLAIVGVGIGYVVLKALNVI
jgi:hypothetical protein